VTTTFCSTTFTSICSTDSKSSRAGGSGCGLLDSFASVKGEPRGCSHFLYRHPGIDASDAGSFSRPLHHFPFHPAPTPPLLPHNVIKSAGASTVFRAAKARKSSRDYPGAMLHGAIADIVKLAPGQGYSHRGASKYDMWRTIYRAAAGLSPQLFYLFETGLKRWDAPAPVGLGNIGIALGIHSHRVRVDEAADLMPRMAETRQDFPPSRSPYPAAISFSSRLFSWEQLFSLTFVEQPSSRLSSAQLSSLPSWARLFS